MLYVKKYRKDKKNKHMNMNNQQTEQQQYFKGLFSFAWIVYPVLLKIFDEKNEDLENMKESNKKKKKKKKKNKKKGEPDNTLVASNNKKKD